MTIRHLDKMFRPRSVALIGASDRQGSVGQTITANLMSAGFEGSIMLVNPKHKKIAGVKCYPSPEDLPEIPDLAVIATPPRTIPDLIRRLGEKGNRAAVIVTAGADRQAILDASRPYCLRMIGPNCFGLMIPPLGLNASFAHLSPQAGDIAFVSQSGAIISAIIDWAASRDIGFSQIVSLGNMADVDIGDVLDYLSADDKSRAILMYMEQITDARKFMSAARAAARTKPVIVIKAGRHDTGARAASSHTGALAGSDIVYDAAFQRAGILRVIEMKELFDAAEILSCARPVAPGKVTVVTNGGGAGVLAVDRLSDYQGVSATLTPETLEALDQVLPASWSRGNPVDIVGDAGPERYISTIEAVLNDCNTDALFILNCPTAMASSLETAKAVADSLKKQGTKGKSVLTCWMGDKTAREARAVFTDAGFPVFETPEDAIRGYSYLASHARLQEELMRTPPARADEDNADLDFVRSVIGTALGSGRTILTEAEAKDILSAYGIPTVPVRKAASPQDVHNMASDLLRTEKKVAVKILSETITHKSDVGGVALDLDSAARAQAAAQDMQDRLGERIHGFTVQPMIDRPFAHELILGMATDPVFGPVILFGAGGTATELIGDRAVTLPPLDLRLARSLMERTAIFRLLQGYRHVPAANLDAIADILVRLSQMISDIPAIQELDINPLIADETGVLALDARIIVSGGPRTPMAIRPYPRQWEGKEILPDGRGLTIRPIRPEDERYYDLFIQKLDPEDIRHRLFTTATTVSHSFIARLTQIDYARAMAFIAVDPDRDEMLGVVRLYADPDYKRAEFAIITRSDQKRKGIGKILMKKIISYAASEGIETLYGQIMAENEPMLAMCRKMNFENHLNSALPWLFDTVLQLRPGKK